MSLHGARYVIIRDRGKWPRASVVHISTITSTLTLARNIHTTLLRLFAILLTAEMIIAASTWLWEQKVVDLRGNLRGLRISTRRSIFEIEKISCRSRSDYGGYLSFLLKLNLRSPSMGGERVLKWLHKMRV
jgi:hypothetical protein